MGESSAILSPANRRVHANPFGSLPPPKPYGLPERNEPEVGWFAMARRHQFLLFMLGILTFLCTVYLYFAITMGAGDSCAGLQGTQRAACRVANGGLGHRRLLEDGHGHLEELGLSSSSGMSEEGRSRGDLAEQRMLEGESHVVDDGEETPLVLYRRLYLDPVSGSYSAYVTTTEDTPKRLPCSMSRSLNWCFAPKSSEDRYNRISVIGLLQYQPSRRQAIDILSELDRILRPGGTAFFWDTPDMVEVVREAASSLKWQIISYQAASSRVAVTVKKVEGDVGGTRSSL